MSLQLFTRKLFTVPHGPAREALLRQEEPHNMAARLPLPPASWMWTSALRDMHMYTHRKQRSLPLFFLFTTGIFFLPLKLACDALTNIMQRDLWDLSISKHANTPKAPTQELTIVTKHSLEFQSGDNALQGGKGFKCLWVHFKGTMWWEIFLADLYVTTGPMWIRK